MRIVKRLSVAAGVTGLAIAGGTFLLGQATPTTQPTRPTTGPFGFGPTSRNGGTRPTKIAMYFKDAEINTVLEHLSNAAGLTILPKPGLVLTGRVTIMAAEPLPVADAVSKLNSQLRDLGFGVVQQGDVLRVMSKDDIKKFNVPVKFGSDPELVADNEDVQTWVIPLKNVDVTRLRQDLAPLLPLEADIAANGGSNTLIITDTANSIKRVMRIISALDAHDPEETAYKIFELKFANATATAKLIQSIFPQANAQQNQQQNTRGFAPGGFQPGGGFQFGGGGGGGGRSSRGGDRGGGGAGGAGGASVDRARSAHMNVAADDRTNRLIVTAPADTLKLIEAIVKEIDQDQTVGLELKLFKLSNSDATSAAKMINSVFSSQTLTATGPGSSSGSSGFSGFGGFRGGGSSSSGSGGTAAGNGGLDIAAGRVNAVADDRTNSIVVTAPSKAMDMIKGMVLEMDSNPESVESFFIYPLRNAQASNLEYVLNTLFGNSSGGSSSLNRGGTSSRSGSSSGGRSSGSSFGGGSSGGGLGGSFGSSSSSFNGSGRSRGSTSYGSIGGSSLGSLGNRGGSQGAAGSELAGQVFVVADTDTNSLLVTVATRFADPVKKIIANLDRPVPQVLIKVLVCEVTHDNSVDLGLDFSVINRRPSGQGTSISSAFGNSSLNTGLVISTLEDKLNAQLHLLATSGKLDVLSRPYILASDNQPASITVGNSVPFITNTRITDTGQQINTVQYQDVGIILNVTPHINPDGLVIMDVQPEVSQLSGTSVPIGNGVNAPVILTRSADSRVGVRTGQTIVIGGLMEDRKTSTVDKLPILGDIPLIGNLLFSRTQVTKSKTELLFFITPHVAQQPDLLQDATAQERQGLQITPNAVGPGKFDDHMNGMQRGNMPTTKPANSKEVSETIPIPPKPKQPSNQGQDFNSPGQQFNPGQFNQPPGGNGGGFNGGFGPPGD